MSKKIKQNPVSVKATNKLTFISYLKENGFLNLPNLTLDEILSNKYINIFFESYSFSVGNTPVGPVMHYPKDFIKINKFIEKHNTGTPSIEQSIKEITKKLRKLTGISVGDKVVYKGSVFKVYNINLNLSAKKYKNSISVYMHNHRGASKTLPYPELKYLKKCNEDK